MVVKLDKKHLCARGQHSSEVGSLADMEKSLKLSDNNEIVAAIKIHCSVAIMPTFSCINFGLEFKENTSVTWSFFLSFLINISFLSQQ